jgi:hypothetical protein
MFLKIFGFLFLLSFVLFLHVHMTKQWKRGVAADFEAALLRVQVETYELLADRARPPNGGRSGEVYRIVRSHDDRYFLYLLTPRSPGVIQPLSKERALLAAKVNG